MGGRLRCRLCSAGLATMAMLALAPSSSSTVHAANLPAREAQWPFLLSQGHQAGSQNPLLQKHAPVADLALPASSRSGRTYSGEAVVRVSFDGLVQQEVDQILYDLETAQLDIWQRRRNQFIDIRISHDFYENPLYRSLQHRMEVTIPSIENAIEQEAQSQRAASLNISTQNHVSMLSDPSGGLHSLYHSHASIESLLKLLASDYSDFAKLERIGESAEGRSIFALRISDYRKSKKASEVPQTWRTYSRHALRMLWPVHDPSETNVKRQPKHKLGFALLGGQHAREWISPAALIYIAHSLINSASQASTSSVSTWSDDQQEIMTLLSDYELHFIPMSNPDGYVYAWDHERLWVRNRQYIGLNETRCHGIDLNRNWGYKWERPYRPNPCSDLYPGSEPFEAVELRAIKEYLQRIKASTRLDVFLDIHNFGQMIMYPYSYSCSDVPRDAENLFEALLRASKAIHGVHKQNYDVGGVCDVSYTATGQSLDWTYHDLGAKWSFAANLRDEGVHGFLLPPDQIVPTGQEILAGLLDLAQFIAQKERIED